MIKSLTSIFLVLTSIFITGLKASAQINPDIRISNTTLLSSQENFPFWLRSNRHGKIATEGHTLNLTEIGLYQSSQAKADSLMKWELGLHFVGGLGETKYLQANRLFGGIVYKGMQLKGGMFYDPIEFGGLSTSNGNMARSGNARPYPRLQFSTDGFRILPFGRNRLALKAEYDEGWLNDKRYVENTHLHHKSLYLSYRTETNWYFEAGAEHYVMWGGTSPDEGKLPHDFAAYLRYISASRGSEDFPETDQNNVAGNQVGTYQFKLSRTFESFDVTFYLSHPFEDHSGKNWRNWRDNLLGLYFNFKNGKVITDVLYEYTYTLNQSVRDSLYHWSESDNKWHREFVDNYFNHSIYRSDFTYYHLLMCSPLFGPIIDTEGVVTGIRSNRFYSHHFGAKGYVKKHLQWKSLLTLVHHLGTYSKPYDPVHRQLSGLLELSYVNQEFPVELGLSVAGDRETNMENNTGIQFWISKSW